MAQENTFAHMTLNPSHPVYVAMTPEARENAMLHIWAGNAAYRAYMPNDLHAPTINGLLGHAGRAVADNLSLMVGMCRPLDMPVIQFSALNIAPVLEISRCIQKGALVVQIRNRGNAVGSVAGQWRTGFNLLAEEVEQYVIYPRSVWAAVSATSAAPSASIENFVYLPVGSDSKFIFSVTGTSGGTYAVTMYGFDPISGTVVRVPDMDFGAAVPGVFEFNAPQYPFLLPVFSTMAGGSTLSLNMGVRIARLG